MGTFSQSQSRRIPFECFPDINPNFSALLLLGLFWATLSKRVNLGRSDIAGCPWDLPPSSGTDAPQCALKDSLETPNAYLCGFFALLLAVVFAIYKKNPRKLQQWTFFTNFALVIVLQCLSSFSGFLALPKLYWIPVGWGVLGRPLWLWFLAEASFWNWSYLGVYEDFHFREASLDVVDKIGATVWRFSPPSENNIPEFPFSPAFLPWTDTAVRLAYLTLLDNTMFVLWLRYVYQHAPYSPHISNSEILTILLFISMALYTYARMRNHVVFLNDEELGLEKQSAPFSRYTMTGELLGRTASCQRYRKISTERRILLLCMIPCFAFVLATVHTILKFLWGLMFRGGIRYLQEQGYIKRGYSKEQAAEMASRDVQHFFDRRD